MHLSVNRYPDRSGIVYICVVDVCFQFLLHLLTFLFVETECSVVLLFSIFRPDGDVPGGPGGPVWRWCRRTAIFLEIKSNKQQAPKLSFITSCYPSLSNRNFGNQFLSSGDPIPHGLDLKPCPL